MTSGTADVPRIRPLPPADWPPAMREALAALRPPEPRHPLPERGGDRPKGLNVLRTLARHPALARAFHTFNGHVLFASTLSARQRELLVLRVAAVREAEYEWAQHVVLAADAGLDGGEVAAIAQGGRPGVVAAGAGDAGGRGRAGGRGDDRRRHPGGSGPRARRQQIMDLVFTVGAYDLLAMAFRSFRVELDDDLREKRASRLRRLVIPSVGESTEVTTDRMPHFTKPAEGSWTEHYGIDTGPVSYEDSISPGVLRARARRHLPPDVAERRPGRAAAQERQLLHPGARRGPHLRDRAARRPGRGAGLPQHVPPLGQQAGVERLPRRR